MIEPGSGANEEIVDPVAVICAFGESVTVNVPPNEYGVAPWVKAALGDVELNVSTGMPVVLVNDCSALVIAVGG